MSTSTTKIAGEDMTDHHVERYQAEQAAQSMSEPKRGTDAQILFERELTCSAINGAMAFGYQNTNPPPSDDHWLAPFWKVGRKQAEMESALLASKPAVPQEYVYETYTGQNGWLEVTQEEYDRTKDKYEHRIRRAPTPQQPAQSAEQIEQYVLSVLPSVYYMDPPDGGSVTVLEQLRRMADDAAKYRALLAAQTASGDEHG